MTQTKEQLKAKDKLRRKYGWHFGERSTKDGSLYAWKESKVSEKEFVIEAH